MSKPWMALYIGDYLADTAHLRAAESGAYLHLIMHYWRKGSLPDDDLQLATIAKMTMDEWAAARPILIQFFQPGWRHKRIDLELAESDRLSERARRAGEASGKRRVDAKFELDANLIATKPQLDANLIATKPQPLHSHSHSHSQEEDSSSLRSHARTPGKRLPDDWRLMDQDFAFAQTVLAEPSIATELEKFRDYWHARAGPNAVKRDWSATWRNWCRKAAEQVPSRQFPLVSVVKSGKDARNAEQREYGTSSNVVQAGLRRVAEFRELAGRVSVDGRSGDAAEGSAGGGACNPDVQLLASDGS